MDHHLDILFRYHELTKHRTDRYAPGPGGLDWATQPNPFRRYAGATVTLLELPELDEPARVEPAGVDAHALARLFYDSMAISAWKQAGDSRWALRVNPSSGNLHPTEAYLICDSVPGLAGHPGVYHYAPDEHGLECRARLTPHAWAALSAGFPPGTIFVGLCSILWREAWKYGERAFRYCQHDIGHALAAIGIAAGRLGWRARLLNGLEGPILGRWLGVNAEAGDAPEHPDCLLAIVPGRTSRVPVLAPAGDCLLQAPVDWQGQPNRLSPETVAWPELGLAAETVFQAAAALDQTDRAFPGRPGGEYSRRLLHQRRSAVAMDGETRLDPARFYAILRAVMPEREPFTVLPWAPRAHLVLFVHRIDGLDPGLYCLPRRAAALPELQRAFRREFSWQTPPGCPEDVPLRLLVPAACEEAARVISCNQHIASDGCFSLGMLAEFERPLTQFGPACYPRLFWECGFIGQILYLEAEKAGIRATGIGCFFDDAMHQILGLESRQFQSLYHFTLGGPEEDRRITTLPGYERSSAQPNRG